MTLDFEFQPDLTSRPFRTTKQTHSGTVDISLFTSIRLGLHRSYKEVASRGTQRESKAFYQFGPARISIIKYEEIPYQTETNIVAYTIKPGGWTMFTA